MKTWREDRETLRSMAKEPGLAGEKATLLFTLISHMRGKLHMRSYKLYSTGWRGWKHPARPGAVLSEKLKRSYHNPQEFYERAVIETLEDQAEWIRAYASAGDELVQRVLANDYAVEERLTATA